MHRSTTNEIHFAYGFAVSPSRSRPSLDSAATLPARSPPFDHFDHRDDTTDPPTAHPFFPAFSHRDAAFVLVARRKYLSAGRVATRLVSGVHCLGRFGIREASDYSFPPLPPLSLSFSLPFFSYAFINRGSS